MTEWSLRFKTPYDVTKLQCIRRDTEGKIAVQCILVINSLTSKIKWFYWNRLYTWSAASNINLIDSIT